MTRASRLLLFGGVLLLVALLVREDATSILGLLSLAGWGLLLVALFHVLPLILDAVAIRVLFIRSAAHGTLRDAVVARWAGESASSLMPAGQIGGPVLMARQLSLRGLTFEDAAAAITVSTTLQTLAQVVFALCGVMLLAGRVGYDAGRTVGTPALIASAVLTVPVVGFYFFQRRGLFGRVSHWVTRFAGKRDWRLFVSRAESIDLAVESTYRRRGAVASSFSVSLIGWAVGTGEIVLLLDLLGHPVSWLSALLLESLGQAVRRRCVCRTRGARRARGGLPAARISHRPQPRGRASPIARETGARAPARRPGAHLYPFIGADLRGDGELVGLQSNRGEYARDYSRGGPRNAVTTGE